MLELRRGEEGVVGLEQPSSYGGLDELGELG